MKLGIPGLLIGILLLGFAPLVAQNSGSGTGKSEPAAQITLTTDHSAAYFPVAPETVLNRPSTLAVKVTRIVNPDRNAFQIFVCLIYRSAAGDAAPHKILIGNFGLYPVDQPGAFQLRSSGAFARLKAASRQPIDVRLLLEMRRLHETQPWTPIEVTLAQPEWKTEPGK